MAHKYQPGHRYYRSWVEKEKRKALRTEVYNDLLAAHGKVPCFVCVQHVPFNDASLEHVIEKARGGTDSRGNLAISHRRCNHERGSAFNCARQNV